MRQPGRNYQVAVPTYRRPGLLENATLNLLLCRGVPPHRITLFTHQHDPAVPQYRELADHKGVGLEITTVRGINQQRRIIAAHYPPGTPVVTADDDITDVVRATDSRTLTPVTELARWFRSAFTDTAAADLNVWGTTPTVNPFYMRPGRAPSQGLKFLIATLWGFYARPGHPVHDTSVEVKEDYEISLRAWWYDGGALRFDDVAAQADHYRAAGGCQDYRDTALSEAAASQLERDWPGLVRRNTARSSGHTEVLLRPMKRHSGRSTDVPPPGRH